MTDWREWIIFFKTSIILLCIILLEADAYQERIWDGLSKFKVAYFISKFYFNEFDFIFIWFNVWVCTFMFYVC